MKSYVLIYAYTIFSEEETTFWNNLALLLKEKGYSLFMLAPAKPKSEVKFLYHKFVEKLDQVPIDGVSVDDTYNDGYFECYLERELVWYGDSDKNRLLAAKKLKKKYNEILEELNPSILVLANGEHASDMILKDEAVSRGTPIMYLERGCLPKTWHIDELGITAGTQIALTNESELNFQNLNCNDFINYKKHYLSEKYTWWHQPDGNKKNTIRERFNIKEKTKIILFANQLDNDTSNFMYSPFYETNVEAFSWLCNKISAIKDDFFLLAKKHPYYKGKDEPFQTSISENNIKGAWVDDLSLFDCLEECDLVCAVNSTLIYEALIYEKPVLQLGRSILSNKNIVYDLKSLNDMATLKRWFYKKDFQIKLSKYEKFMSYLIKKELSFFSKGCLDLGFNDHYFFYNQIKSKIDRGRKGNDCLKYGMNSNNATNSFTSKLYVFFKRLKNKVTFTN